MLEDPLGGPKCDRDIELSVDDPRLSEVGIGGQGGMFESQQPKLHAMASNLIAMASFCLKRSFC